MWSSNKSNHPQNSVVVYQPILYGRKPNHDDLQVSFVGGPPVDDAHCAVCNSPLRILVQLSLENATLQVLACHNGPCWRSLFANNNDLLCYGGGGVVQGRRLALRTDNFLTQPALETSDWVDSNKESRATLGDWGSDPTLSTDDLEAKLAAMETRDAQPAKPVTPPQPKHNPVNERPTFTSFLLHSSREPPAKRQAVDADDVGIHSADDKKIHAMLAKYMEEEEDETILQALRGGKEVATGASSHSSTVERDEKLSATERALFAYTDRIKRCPRQVIRCARGGQPMWSVPTRRDTPSSQSKQLYGIERPIPKCGSCGEERVFEFQVVPSLLHTLGVDRNGSDGMNWGNIAVYSCACDAFCVIQDAVDERPTGPRRQMTDEAVFIPDGTQFAEDDFSENEDENMDEEQYEDDDDDW